MNDYLGLLGGVIAAGIGGELFVRGAVGFASWARVSPGIIGATVAAFATSSPELSVSVNSALAATPEIALGDALGSNVVNVALILALALVIAGIQCSRDSVKRDFPVALLVPVITGVLFLDGALSRIDGMLLLALFAAWLLASVMEARRQRSAAPEATDSPPLGGALAFGVVGMGFLVLAGTIIVASAKGIAARYGIDEFIIGATLVALGTSTPELATTVVAKMRGHDEVSLGTILGSNIFNGLLIVAVAAIIHPIHADGQEVAVALGVGVIALAVTWPPRNGFINRRRGVMLLALYAIYVVAIALGATS